MTTLAETENLMVALIDEHGKKILSVIAGVIVLFGALFYFSTGSQQEAFSDYVNADVYYNRVLESAFSAEDLSQNPYFIKLQEILKRHPELKAKFDAPLAQAFILQKNAGYAKKFGEYSISRLSQEDLIPYVDFSKAAVQSAASEYPAALTSALDLQKRMIEEKKQGKQATFGDFLFAYNLLRIASLEGEEGSLEGERAAWSDLEMYMEGKGAVYVDPVAFATLQSVFSHGNVSLKDFISYRLHALSPKSN